MEQNGGVGGDAVAAHVAQHEALFHTVGRTVEEVGRKEDALAACISHPAVASHKDGKAVGKVGTLTSLEPKEQWREQDKCQRGGEIEQALVAATGVGADGVEVVEIEVVCREYTFASDDLVALGRGNLVFHR